MYRVVSTPVVASASVALSTKPCSVSEADNATSVLSIKAELIFPEVLSRSLTLSQSLSFSHRLSLSAEFLNNSPFAASAEVVTLLFALPLPIGLSGYIATTFPDVGAVLNVTVLVLIV